MNPAWKKNSYSITLFISIRHWLRDSVPPKPRKVPSDIRWRHSVWAFSAHQVRRYEVFVLVPGLWALYDAMSFFYEPASAVFQYCTGCSEMYREKGAFRHDSKEEILVEDNDSFFFCSLSRPQFIACVLLPLIRPTPRWYFYFACDQCFREHEGSWFVQCFSIFWVWFVAVPVFVKAFLWILLTNFRRHWSVLLCYAVKTENIFGAPSLHANSRSTRRLIADSNAQGLKGW